jgi:hypothetical protein
VCTSLELSFKLLSYHPKIYATVESGELPVTIALLKLAHFLVLQKAVKVCVDYYWRFQKPRSISLNQGQKAKPAVDIYCFLSPIFMISECPYCVSDYRLILIYSKIRLHILKNLCWIFEIYFCFSSLGAWTQTHIIPVTLRRQFLWDRLHKKNCRSNPHWNGLTLEFHIYKSAVHCF